MSASGDIYYYDYETVKWAGGTAYAWVLTDYIKPLNGVLSFGSLVEVECGTPLRFKWLSTDYMSGPMGKGDLLGSTKEDASWSYPRPNTVWDSVVGSLCQVGKLKG